MNAKELFRKQIADKLRGEFAKVKPNPDVLIKRECTHRECAELTKCKKEQSYGGVQV